MKLNYQASPVIRHKDSTSQMMKEVTICLLVILGFAVYYYSTVNVNYALRVVLLAIDAIITAVVVEMAWAKFYLKVNPVEYVLNSFPWVTAIILTMMCPVAISYYALTIATVFAILVGKLLFGGFGKNIFNPAALGRAIIFATFMTSMATDVVTSATPTTTIASYNWLIVDPQLYQGFMTQFGGLTNLFIGFYPGAIGETSTMLILLSGVYLAYRNIIDWRIPVFYLGGVFVLSSIVAVVHGMGIWYPIFSILSGGVAFGAVFMATDPVTNPTSYPARIIFAIGLALITVLIRLKGNYPEGVLYSILIMNMLTPLIEISTIGKQFDNIKRNTLIIIGLSVISCLLIFGIAKSIEPVVVNNNGGCSISQQEGGC